MMSDDDGDDDYDDDVYGCQRMLEYGLVVVLYGSKRSSFPVHFCKYHRIIS